MRYRLEFRRYLLPLRAAVRTAHGVWAQREGLLVRLAGEDGAVGFGEAAVIPWFGSETADEAEAAADTEADAEATFEEEADGKERYDAGHPRPDEG